MRVLAAVLLVSAFVALLGALVLRVGPGLGLMPGRRPLPRGWAFAAIGYFLVALLVATAVLVGSAEP